MIYTCKAKRQNLKAAAVTATFTVAFLCDLFLLPFPLFLPYRHVMEFLLAVFAAFAVTVAGRYLLREYRYILTENGEGVDFVVTEIQGKRKRTVCRIALSDIRETADERRDNRKALNEKCRSMKRYDYCIDLGAREAFRILLSEEKHEVSVRLSVDDGLKTHLAALLKNKSI